MHDDQCSSTFLFFYLCQPKDKEKPMALREELEKRSNSSCELCTSTENLEVMPVEPESNGRAERSIIVCGTCTDQINNKVTMDPNHWRCLTDSMWSETPVVQVMAYRMLHRLRSEGWPMDLLDQMYLDDETLSYAKAGIAEVGGESAVHRDSNGVELFQGDNVILIKNLDVKGANFTAKRGTSVRRITLVKDNVEHIEGRVNGQQIVILTQFVKKS
ncbi:MAG: protein PhnA [Bacteroidia bacterium]